MLVVVDMMLLLRAFFVRMAMRRRLLSLVWGVVFVIYNLEKKGKNYGSNN
jgi:hypothetical protein